MEVVNDVDKSILVLQDAATWMKESGKHVSKWWDKKNLTKEFLLQYAKPDEFYVLLQDNKPAAAAILQISQNSQDWESVDRGKSPKALYIHWLAVASDFKGQHMSEKMIDFAEKLAQKNDCLVLRVDTNAEETKLREVYESLGFHVVGEVQEEYRKTAFYEKEIK